MGGPTSTPHASSLTGGPASTPYASSLMGGPASTLHTSWEGPRLHHMPHPSREGRRLHRTPHRSREGPRLQRPHRTPHGRAGVYTARLVSSHPQDVVNTHPGLSFLKEASEFHSRYITTVIQRIFYAVNRSWSGRNLCRAAEELLLQNVALLEEEADINQLTEFFSYEHFYVIYCKFWELDTNHDLLIDADDLARHNDHAISTKMIDRIFSGAVTRGRKVQKEGKISYADFVWFLISEEDKKTPTSIEYWFRCMDLDGDGALSMFQLEYFYEEQCRRLDSMAIEALPFQDCLCQMLDLVKPRTEGKIMLQDLKRCKLANVFFDTFFNIEKYLDHEQKEQISLLRDGDSGGPELSDWGSTRLRSTTSWWPRRPRKSAGRTADPTLAEMGKNLKEAVKMLEDSQRRTEEENGKKLISRDIPGPLQGSGQDMVSILQLVQNLMHGDEDEEPQSPRIQNIGEQGHVALLGHSLGAYISTLDKEKLRKLTTRILSDTTLCLCRIFRYENGCAYFHEEEREGLAKICRLAIHSRYEDFVVDGFSVLYNKKPVIYLSAAARPGLGQYLCNQLGLPFPCLCRVPCNTMFGSQHQMDVAFLEKLIKDDIERGRLPLLLVANAGTAAVGHTDKIGRLKELCEQYGIWLHVEGVNLATLALGYVSSSVLAAAKCDSMTMTPGPWLGLPAVPAVTLYKHDDPALSQWLQESLKKVNYIKILASGVECYLVI
ncbi:uncharacterized protein LOC100609914 isoform X3 [Pan troglodytes]|uniref:uncharacterized protein LOC100609914 isoform X3 n=1 Tax=Pan troglodytes TaxID=9598 RepID=UPI003013AF45